MGERQVEILAPAGSWENMRAAMATGADAVYMGGSQFGARAYTDDPSEKRLVEAIDHMHLHGHRLYITVSTLLGGSKLKKLAAYIKPCYDQGLNEVIMQDLGVLQVLKENSSDLGLYTNTQMTITSVYGAGVLRDLGCSRAVTSKEMFLDKIRHVHEQVDVEVESFAHDALCYCYSGQCLMSSLIGGRSGNRGRCAQPCRPPYRVYEGGEGKSAAPNQENRKHVLSLKGLCTLDILLDIIDSSVYSLKIEDRMRSLRCTAEVMSAYRRYVNLYLEQGRRGYRVEGANRKMLLDLFNHGGFTSGYYEAHNGRGMVVLEEKPEFREGNQRLFDYLGRTYVAIQQKEPVGGHVILETGKPSVMTLSCSGVKAVVNGQVPEAAQKQPMAEEKVLRQLNKTGNTPFVLECLSAKLKGDLFLPVQALNELRRSGLGSLQSAILKKYRRGPGMPKEGVLSENKDSTDPSEKPAAQPWILAVSLEEPCRLEPALRQQEVSDVYVDADGFGPDTWRGTTDRCHKGGKSCCLTLPHISRSHTFVFLKDHITEPKHASFNEVVVRALERIRRLENQQITLPFITDAFVYAWNDRTIGELASREPRVVTIPWEFNSRELEPVFMTCSRAGVPGELVVYGYAPMMMSAQCMTRTVKSCAHKRGLLRMKDRTGAVLMVKNHRHFCCNAIYNPSPLSLLGNEGLIRRMGTAYAHLQLTVKDGQQTGKVLEAFSKAFMDGETTEPPFKDFARGHFKHGVE